MPKLPLRRNRRKGGFGARRNVREGGILMMFSQSDIDVLRLICWCQYVKPGSLSGLSTPVEQGNLLGLGLIQFHEKSGAFTLTRKGRSFLQEILTLPDLTKSYHKDAIERRLRLTKLALTAYRGNVNIFVTAPEELSNSPVLFLSAIARSRGTIVTTVEKR